MLSGWTPPPWGQIQRGPAAPSLDALIYVEQPQLDSLIKLMFNVDCPVPYRTGDALAPVLQAALAALIMHYQERKAEGEAPLSVRLRMHQYPFNLTSHSHPSSKR